MNKKSKMGTDRPTNRPTDGQTDKAGCRVAYHATKNETTFFQQVPQTTRFITNTKSDS